jgi:hypothetical protein
VRLGRHRANALQRYRLRRVPCASSAHVDSCICRGTKSMRSRSDEGSHRLDGHEAACHCSPLSKSLYQSPSTPARFRVARRMHRSWKTSIVVHVNCQGLDIKQRSCPLPATCASLHRKSVLLLEPRSYPFACFRIFINTSEHAAFFSGDERLGCEIVDTVVETPLDESSVCLSTPVSPGLGIVEGDTIHP